MTSQCLHCHSAPMGTSVGLTIRSKLSVFYVEFCFKYWALLTIWSDIAISQYLVRMREKQAMMRTVLTKTFPLRKPKNGQSKSKALI